MPLAPGSKASLSAPLPPSPCAAFIDADEFLVINDDTADLPTLLRDYEQHGGLAVSMLLFGSSGHKAYQNSSLAAYTACVDPQVSGERPARLQEVLSGSP